MERDKAELSDIQAESGVIGTLIYHPEYILNSNTFLKPNHFFNVENGCIYWAINELLNDGIENIDAFNLSNKLRSNGKIMNAMEKYNLPSVQEYIELYKQLARHSIEEYISLAKTVTAFAFKRKLYERLHDIESKCFDSRLKLSELNNAVYQGIDTITSEFVMGSDTKTLGDEIDKIWDEIVSRRTSDGSYGFPSKFPSMKNYFSFERGEMYTIQGKYKEGKSTYVLNETVHKVDNGIPTLIIDTEINTRLYTERLLSHLSGVPVEKVKSGACSDEEQKKIENAKQWIKTHKIKHIYKPDITDSELYSICKLWINKIGIQFLVFDCIKSHEGSTGDNYNVLGRKTDFLHNKIAGELNLCVLATCQLNRNGEVADSVKINQHTSIAIKYGKKTKEQIIKDGLECGNVFAKVYVNRNGAQMMDDDEDDYIDLYLDGNTSTITEVKQHKRNNAF